MNTEHARRFAEIYNNPAKYPTLSDVGKALGISQKTCRNFSAKLRRRHEQGQTVPALIWRGPVDQAPAYALPVVEVEEIKLTPAEHAAKRASKIQDATNELFTSTRWPVINPEVLVTEHRTARRYDRLTGDYQEIEGTPRTWLTDTLRVAPIADVRGRTFIFSGAQNDAPLHEGFWGNLSAYAAEIGAEIAIGPWTYETNWWDENSPTAREYDDRIEGFLCFGQLALGDNFMFGGEMNTLPTSPRPVSDLTSYGQGRWAVYPHARLQLLSVPSTMPGEQAHQVMTTGAVTRPKVIPRKAGIKSIFHHIIGATIVEFDQDGDVFCRQINASEDGSFYDLEHFVENGIVTSGHRARAVTLADMHLAKLRQKNALATIGFDYRLPVFTSPGSVIEVLNPEHVFLEDIHDNESRNHHHDKDVSHNFEMASRGRESVQDEVRRSSDFLTRFEAEYPEIQVHVVESNHDVALERYIREGRYRMDGINLTYGLKLDLAYHEWREQVGKCLDAEIKPPKFSMLEYAVRAEAPALGAHWIYDGSDSFVLDGIELGHHGHRGTNGAHGSAAGFARLGRRITIGDKHSPQILDGVFVAGVMELQHGYNKGPSGWCNSHVVQYPNGKRTLVTLQNGKWRA